MFEDVLVRASRSLPVEYAGLEVFLAHLAAVASPDARRSLVR